MTLVDRTQAPPPAPIRAFEFPEVESAELANGVAFRTARLPRLPLVSAVVVLGASESSLSGSDAGLAVLTAAALEGGTARRTAGELAEALENIGAELGVSSGWDATTLALTCVAERLPEALALLAEVITGPAFPDAEVGRVRDQQLARIRQRAMDPGSLANDWAARLIHAEGVPYGRPAHGTPESVAGFGHGDVQRFAADAYRARGSGLVLAGDVETGAAAALAEAAFGAWTGEAPPRPRVEARARHGGRTIHLVHRPGAVQSELRVGHVGVPRRHEDFFPLIVANSVLGGAFTSRLNLNLREQHGFTYGVRSRFHFRRGPGPFVISASVGSDVTADAVRETLHEMERFAEGGPTVDEVEAARDYIAGVFPLRLETTAQVAAHVAELLVHDLPEDHHARYRDRVRAVGVEDAAAAARRHVRPGEATVVVVGDADVVQGPLAALGLGPVEVHLPDVAATENAAGRSNP